MLSRLDYSALLPNSINGPGDYVISYGPEPDMVFTVNVFSFAGHLDVSFKFGIVPGPLLGELMAAAIAVFDHVQELNGRPATGNITSDGAGPEIEGWPV